MSKQTRLRPAALAVAILALLLNTTGRSVEVRQERGIAAGTSSASRAAAVEAATAEVLRETSEVRQLSILRPVKSGAQSRDQIQKYITENLNEENTPQKLHASEATLKKLGLVPQGFDLKTFLIKLLTEQVAGYYDAKREVFYLADWIDLDGQRPVMAHELTHALQDQHFNLRRYDKWPKGESDAEMAYHALVEGDATLAMTFYMTRNPARALSFLKSLATSGGINSHEIDNAPRALRESLLFPYQVGMEWAGQVQKRSGWQGVSDAFGNLPRSTEQILHPEKYFAGEAPEKIALADVSNQLGGKWKRLEFDVHGEWSYYLILDQFLQSENESRSAAAGWAGDRYASYENSNGGVLITQMSAWDTERDAVEFFEAYARRCEKRYSNPERINTNGQAVETERTWRTNEGLVFMERRGKRVMVIEGLEDSVKLAGVKRKLWS
jgi:hypothetical protein